MSQFLAHNAWLVPFFPLLGSFIVVVAAKWLREQSHLPIVAGIALSFLVSFSLWMVAGPDVTSPAIEWLTISGFNVPIQFRLDGLTTMMLAMVTFVATLIAVFASGYMAGDPGYPRFFALIGLFVFSMTGLVLSNNYVLTYLFWEGVGVCSYMLVGFWHSKPSAAAAAKKAFLVNRIGDFGFAIAIFWLWSASINHDVSYGNVLSRENLDQLGPAAIMGISFLLFWGATAKSAQVPLYVWLPDAMEGPTPVSALIHAATMVTAGVYLIARSTPLLVRAHEVQALVAVIGCLTALLSATIALTQTDLKRVMAYSTVSQLGFMFMGLGAGVNNVAQLAVFAAMFHLFTHAFFKALLFLASGSVMHAMGNVIDMRRFSGLRHRLPITHLTFAAGGLALAGFPLTAGFWSKDEILLALKHAAHQAEPGWGGIYVAVYWIAVLTAFMTAFYTGRAYFLTFWGPEKLPSPQDPEALAEAVDEVDHGSSHTEHDHGHDAGHGHDGHHVGQESPPIMTYPLMILAVCALIVGLIFGPTGLFEHHLHLTLGYEHLGHLEAHGADWLVMLMGSLAAILGLGLSYLFYAHRSPIPAQLAERLRPLYLASYNKFWIDEIYEKAVVGTTLLLAEISAIFDMVIDAIVRGIAYLPRWLGGAGLAPFQNGLVQFYAGVTAMGVAFLLIIVLFWL